MLRRVELGEKNDQGGCGCEKTLKFLRAKGAPQARALLARGHADVLYFDPAEWEEHMQEEEITLRREVEAGRYPVSDYRRILDEHVVIRRMLYLTGKVDPNFARAHAKFEDESLVRAGLAKAD